MKTVGESLADFSTMAYRGKPSYYYYTLVYRKSKTDSQGPFLFLLIE